MKKRVLSAVLVSMIGASLVAAPRGGDDDTMIKLPAAKAARMASALGNVLKASRPEGKVVKAPRPDAAKQCDPEFPVGSLCPDDLDALKECVCLIKEQLEGIASQLDGLQLVFSQCDQLEIVISQLDEISVVISVVDELRSCVGCPCDSTSDSLDFCDCTDVAAIDNSNATVIGYLRTILRELRGLVGTAEYCLPCASVCDEETCSIDDLPGDLSCPSDDIIIP
jgi:hypothetical protein